MGKIIVESVKSSCDIIIIIPVKDNQLGIERLLQSFFIHTPQAYYPKEIIIVDNYSSPAIFLPENLHHSGLTISIEPCHKEGPSSARNKGAQLAAAKNAKWLLFIDSDCLFTETTISGYLDPTLGEALAYQGEIKALGDDWLSQFYDNHRVLAAPYFVDQGIKRPIYLVTANTLIYAPAFFEIGGFDESFKLAAEDVDMGYQLWKHGPLAYANADVRHDFLNGEIHVKKNHVMELINRFKKYAAGDRPLYEKYGDTFINYANTLLVDGDSEAENNPNIHTLLYMFLFFKLHLKCHNS